MTVKTNTQNRLRHEFPDQAQIWYSEVSVCATCKVSSDAAPSNTPQLSQQRFTVLNVLEKGFANTLLTRTARTWTHHGTRRDFLESRKPQELTLAPTSAFLARLGALRDTARIATAVPALIVCYWAAKWLEHKVVHTVPAFRAYLRHALDALLATVTRGHGRLTRSSSTLYMNRRDDLRG